MLNRSVALPRQMYLPDLHPFEHVASAPWPAISESDQQIDWITSIDILESWLTHYVGGHYSDWAYHNLGWGLKPGYCSLAFRRAPDRTLFLLRWG
jgi:hypothetical protein